MTDDEARVRTLIERWAQAVHADDLDGVPISTAQFLRGASSWLDSACRPPMSFDTCVGPSP